MFVMSKHVAPSIVLVSFFALCIARVYSAEPTTRVMVVSVPGGGEPVVARTDAKGTIHLLFNSPSGPQYVQTTDEGKAFGRAITVVDRQSQKPGLEFTAWDMAVDQVGHVLDLVGPSAKRRIADARQHDLLED